MSFWSTVSYRLREILRSMIGARTIEQKLNITPVISSKMESAIERWSAMYTGQAPWIHEPTAADQSRVVSLGLPAMIASEKARMALLEFNSEITTPTEEVEIDNPDYVEPTPNEFGVILPSMEPPTIIEDRPIGPTERAEFLNKEYDKLKRQLRKQMEYGIAKGGLVIKPYVVLNQSSESDVESTYSIEYDFIQADAFYPLAFDSSGKITEAAFLQTKADKNNVYRRLEYHKWENNTVQIINYAYRSTSNTNQQGDMMGIDLGEEISLSTVPEWATLQPKTTVKNVDRPLFAYFKMPEANTVDPSSPLGVSGFSRAESLIKDADMQYSRLLWEYEGGEMAIDVDRDALKTKVDSSGRAYEDIPKGKERLFRKVDLSNMGDTYYPYAPSLRDVSYIQGLNTILMRIEDVCGISRGTLSDSADVARTATELKILKQRSYQTNADIQQAMEDTLKDVIYIMNVYCTLYEITPEGEYDANFEWDDSIIVDVDMELNKRITLQQNGLTSRLETRMWYFGETERQAQEALRKIDEESVEQASNEMGMESAFNKQEKE